MMIGGAAVLKLKNLVMDQSRGSRMLAWELLASAQHAKHPLQEKPHFNEDA
jgi:hypothetical protein